VAKAKVFADRLQQLLRAGLSPNALAQVAQAGADAGVAIADELLAGGAATIEQANDLVAAAQKAAKETGTLAGQTYYNEGTVLAQQLTKGITDVISKYKIKLSSPGLTEKQLNRLRNRFAVDVDFVMQNVPALANGGIVTSPQLALIGEKGPEAVIPLDKMGQMGNVTINVNGGDPQAVVDALVRYSRQNGALPPQVKVQS
jgi:SLT domain-containing protein